MADTRPKSAAVVPLLIFAVAIPLSMLMWLGNLAFSVFTHREYGDDINVIPPTRWLVSTLTPLVIVGFGLRKKSLDKSGAFLALFVGLVLTISSYAFFACLATFFITSSKATKFRSAEKLKLEADFKEGGQRNWLQVLCNSGIATFLALLYILDIGCGERQIDFVKDYRATWLGIGILGAFACCNGDTWASELGTVVGRSEPLLIVNLQKVPRGTNGGVTALGLLFSAVGGTIIGAAYYLAVLHCVDPHILANCPPQWPLIVAGTFAGFAGSLIDSVLGASLQYSGLDEKTGCIVECPGRGIRHISGIMLLDNHSVNLISSIVTALVLPRVANAFWPKRNCLTLLEKYKIIQDMDEKKTTQVEMAQQHGIPCSTLGSILKMREEIVNAVQKEGHNLLARSLKGARHGDLDEILWEWYGQQRAQGILLNGPMMQRKANELAVRLGIENFRCSNGWLDRFRARHGMHRVKRVHGKSLLINPRSKREQFLLVRNVLSRYQPEDVYSADELGMFHNLMPDRTLSVKGNKYKDVKRSKERRLTVLLCCNMDGSDKLKPLVIGKFKKPHSLEDNILPCDYDFNEEVEMTSAVFMRWLACFDTKMSNSDRKVALFINSCVAYPDAVKFRNVELVIMPKNGTSMLRPLDQGILQQVKVKLREMFVRSMVYELDVGKQVKKWDVLRAMEGIVASWNAVKRAVIANCFRDADFIPPIKEEAADIVPSNVAGTEHFAPTLDEEAAIVVLPTIDDAETPDDPLQLDTKPQMGPFMEQQPGLSTAPTTVTVTVVQPCDEKMWQKLSTDSMYDEFIILDDDVGVEGTTDSSIIVEGQQVGEKEMEEDPGDLPTRRDVLKAGYIYSSMLRRLDASEQIWTQFNNVKDFVEQTCSKKQTLITDFFKK